MRKTRLVVILLIIAGAFGWRKYHTSQNTQNDGTSAIDRIIGVTQTGENTGSGDTIDVDVNASQGVEYAGGGEYANYSDEAAQAAVNANKRIILVFERTGEPTSEALHEDIVNREARIPYNTIIFFVNIDTESELANRTQVEQPNTILYINRGGQEVRRTGNGVITLAQLVNSIDGLTTQ